MTSCIASSLWLQVSWLVKSFLISKLSCRNNTEMAGYEEGVVRDVPPSLRSCIITDIELGKAIGRGAHGRILEAKWEGSVVAVKQIHSIYEEVTAQEFESLKNRFMIECDRSNRLRHPNIVRFFGIYFPPRARIPNLVMERLHCSLNHLLERNSLVHLDIYSTSDWVRIKVSSHTCPTHHTSRLVK